METEGTKLRTEEYLFIRSQKRTIHFSTLIFFWNFLFHSYFLVIPTFFLGTFQPVFPLLPSFFLFFYLSTLLSSFLFFVTCISFLSSLCPYFILSVLTLSPLSLLSFPILLQPWRFLATLAPTAQPEVPAVHRVLQVRTSAHAMNHNTLVLATTCTTLIAESVDCSSHFIFIFQIMLHSILVNFLS